MIVCSKFEKVWADSGKMEEKQVGDAGGKKQPEMRTKRLGQVRAWGAYWAQSKKGTNKLNIPESVPDNVRVASTVQKLDDGVSLLLTERAGNRGNIDERLEEIALLNGVGPRQHFDRPMATDLEVFERRLKKNGEDCSVGRCSCGVQKAVGSNK